MCPPRQGVGFQPIHGSKDAHHIIDLHVFLADGVPCHLPSRLLQSPNERLEECEAVSLVAPVGIEHILKGQSLAERLLDVEQVCRSWPAEARMAWVQARVELERHEAHIGALPQPMLAAWCVRGVS